MLLRKEIYFHFFTDLIKNSLGPQSEIRLHNDQAWMKIRVPEKIINVKTVIANIILVFVLIKIRYNPVLITQVILLPIV